MGGLTHGDEVRVVASAPAEYRPSSRDWVVGMRADPAGEGDALVVIEFDDGSSVEVPSGVLQKAS